MKKFYVEITYTYDGTLLIEAETEAEAKEIAKDITFSDPWEECTMGSHQLFIEDCYEKEDEDEEEEYDIWKTPEDGSLSEGDRMMINGEEE